MADFAVFVLGMDSVVRKTAYYWSTCPTMCLEMTDSSIVVNVYTFVFATCRKHCHGDSALLAKLSTLVSGTYKNHSQENIPLLAKVSTLCLEHTESIVRKTVHFWSNCPPLCLEQTDRQYWLQTQVACGQPIHLCEADKSGMFPNIPSCRLPLHQLHHFAVPHTHMDIACNFITNIFQCDTNLNPTC